MGVRIISEEPEAQAALYDSVTGLAFGPVFSERQDAADFLEWYYGTHREEDLQPGRHWDLRTLTPREIKTCVAEWRAFREED